MGEIQRTVNEAIEGSTLKVSLSGAPVMQLEIRNSVQRDRITYNGLGFVIGALICLMFFRRLSLTIIAAAAPPIAIIWALGVLGLIGFKLNLFLNVLTPLIMVIAFSNSMHMVFHIRRHLMRGEDRFEAAKHAIANVGPACVLTSLTTAIALFSMIFAESAMIRTFAIAAAIAAGLAFLAVITLGADIDSVVAA